MKTSNIILLAVFASILIWILAAFLTAKAKILDFVEKHPEIIKKYKENAERETVSLNAFQTIVTSGNGELHIEQSGEFSFDQFIDDNNTANVKNDTLFMTVTGQKCILKVIDIDHLMTTDEVYVSIDDLNTDSLNVIASDDSHLKILGLKTRYFKLTAEVNAEVKLKKVNNENTTADFIIYNNANVTIDNTKGMALSVKKDPEAKFKDD